ncbi:MAG: tetratricopeptide repeat protein [Bacteroidia bacterium]|nr:tetratricopeptide repeat protein [Bacteroidia bacterium]
MLKRVAIFCVGILVFGQATLFAQVPLDKPKQNILYEKFGEAETELKQILTQAPKNIDEVYYLLGMISYKQEDYDKAREYFQAGLKERSGSGLNMAGMGMSMIKESKLAEGYDFCTKALDRSKGKDFDVEVATALAYLEGGPSEIAEAKKILYALKDKDPNDPRPHIHLADYYKKQGVPELAIEEYEKAKELAPDFVQAYAALAELYFEEGKKTGDGNMLNEGVKNANEAIRIDDNFPPSYRIRGELNLLAKRYQAARDDLKKYVSMTDNDLRARIRYASFLFLSENYQEAITELENISTDTVTNVMLRLKGMSYNKMGDQAKAKGAMDEYFSKVKKEDYILWQDYQVTGDIYRAMGDLDKADENYKKMVEKNSDMAVYFEDIAKEYETQAEKIDAEAKGYRTAANTAQADVQKYFDAYNECAKVNDAACADKNKVLMDEAAEKGKQAMAKRDEVIKGQAPFYKLEAHYRQKVVDYAEKESLQNFYRLARAQYNGEMYKESMPNFKKVIELKTDYVPPYNYLLQIANKLEDEDKETMSWYVKEPAEMIVAAFGSKAVGSLESAESKILLIGYEIMANYNFNPTGEENNYHCPEAKPFVDKIYAIDANYARIKNLADYCAEVNR